MPTAILKMRGSWRAETREDEPKTEVSAPEAPVWLSSAAKAHWIELVPMLMGMGVMAREFSVGLALLTDALADWLSESSTIAALPEGTEDHPAYSRKAKAWERVMKSVREFGLTPSAVTGIKTVKGKETTEKGVKRFKLSG